MLLASVSSLGPLGASAADSPSVATEAAASSRSAALYACLPLSFEANQGQTDPRVKYLAHGRGYTLWLTLDEAVLALQKESSRTPAVLHMKLAGANAGARVTGLAELPGKSNYYIGNDPKKWQTDVANYAKVEYASVYPGVDLVYYGNQGQLEYDFVVHPGADSRSIQLAIGSGEQAGSRQKAAGSDAGVGAVGEPPRAHHDAPLRVDANGDLVVGTGDGEVRFHKPLVYQPAESRQWSVVSGQLQRTTNHGPRTKDFLDGKYVLTGNNQVSFEVGSYDRRRPLVIDPVLSYSSYLGGTGGDVAYAIAVDSSGNAYIAGQTFSTDFPTTTPFQSSNNGNGDVFVTKFNSTGSSSGAALLYSTYLGGKGADVAYGIAVGAEGDAFITGSTSSSDFPVSPTATGTTTPAVFQPTYGGGESDAFITQLNSLGDKLAYSSYLGGRGADAGQAIAVDSAGNAYVTGSTQSSDFPTVTGAFQPATAGGSDAFVTEVNFAGTQLLYSTYLGGSNADVGQAIQVDSSGNAYVAGVTFSTNFPTQSPYQSDNHGSPNAFVAELNPTASALVFSTYLGGSNDDRAFGIALDSSGGIYVTGTSLSADFPTTTGSFQAVSHGGGDAFATKFNPGGAGLAYSTFVGGSGSDQGKGIAVDSSGEAFITGFTQSTDFPIADAVQSLINLGLGSSCGGNPCPDAFVTKLNASGNALVYSTYLGGSGADYGYSIALDSTGDPYVTGNTSSSNFPAIAGAHQGVLNGKGNAFIAKIDVANSPNIAVVPATLSFGNQALSVPSPTQTMTVVNAGTAPLSITEITITETTAGSPTEFSETDDCIGTVNPGGSTCKINVTFNPSGLGARAATLTITDNAASSPQTFALTGTGVTAGTAVTLAPTSLSFSNQAVGTVSGPQSITITNTGTATLTITSISASGDFLQTNTCGTLNNLLNPGQSCTVSVTFAPTASGARSGSLSVSDNATGSPQTAVLSGTGTAQFALSSSSPTTTIVVGTTSVNIPVSATGSSFTGTITPSCSAAGQTCTFNPTTILAGQTTTLTVSGLSATTPSPFNFTVNGLSGSQTATLSLTILFQDYSMSATPLLNTVTAGSPGAYTVIVTPLNGFNQQVNLACTSTTLPPGATCVFNSTGVTPNGSPASVKFNINTTKTSSLPGPPAGPMRKLPLYIFIGLFGFGALRSFIASQARSSDSSRRRLRRWISVPGLVAGLALALLLEAGCRSSTLTTVGTPTGNYTITVTGTLNSNSAVVRSTIVNLAVT
jgi:hypothetical protein